MSEPSAAPRRAASWFDREDAPDRREINTCIHCGLCLTACPTYRELKIEPDSPRGRLYLMRGLAEGRIAPSDPLLGHLDLCLDCRACETVCPAGVPYGRLLEAARGQLQRRAARKSPLRVLGEWALVTLFPYRGRMHLAADLLRLGQRGPIAGLLRSRWARRALPGFAARGLEITPALESRSERRLERVAEELPAGASMTARPEGVVFRPAGTPRARVAFFTSCVMEVMFPRVNRDAVRLLVTAGCEVTVPRDQTCCGALHAHAGLRRAAKDLARRNVRAFGAGHDFIVNDSAGCGAALREAGHLLHEDRGAAAAQDFSSRVRDISEVLAELPLPEPRSPLAWPRDPSAPPVSPREPSFSAAPSERSRPPVSPHPPSSPSPSPRDPSRPLRIAYHDPCHLAHAQRVRSQPRALLRSIPGIELVELPNSDWCCGSAGVYNLTHPEMAEAQLVRKLDSIESVAPDLVVASNPGCLLHMARGGRARGSRVRVVHLVEVLARAHPPTERAPAQSEPAANRPAPGRRSGPAGESPTTSA